ncbi:MAG: hypothetical protein FWD41_02370, partial [Actinomycetia bacterium]|nr:hypothetical protein [Actinomycetes bacterium]
MFRKANIGLALLLAFVLCFSAVSSAFAEGDPLTGGTETDPIEASIKKVFKMPQGTPLPGATFDFIVTSISANEVAATTANMPTLGASTSNPLEGKFSVTYSD